MCFSSVNTPSSSSSMDFAWSRSRTLYSLAIALRAYITSYPNLCHEFHHQSSQPLSFLTFIIANFTFFFIASYPPLPPPLICHIFLLVSTLQQHHVSCLLSFHLFLDRSTLPPILLISINVTT